ncbi:MAG TPA: GTPase [Gemmataceae bacterium]|jgi:tRNA modification GTPase|nr:GTPase [Gemmataceae bacterium]
MTHVTVLTPPCSAAVAVLEVRGPDAWPVLQQQFRTAAGKSLSKPPARFSIGRIGDPVIDEIILAQTAPETFEVHSHGGPRVVKSLLAMLSSKGIQETSSPANVVLRMLTQARTVRTASILLDQFHGAYDRAAAIVQAGGPAAERMRALLHRNARVGRHLVEPWKVAIVGAPNVGKSSMLNALAGFGRSVVSPIPGTTRDAVSVSLACDGWPIDFIDTAGLRESNDAIEAEGIERTRAAAATSDLVLWIVDASQPEPEAGARANGQIVVLNKIDLIDLPADAFPAAAHVSALTGAGINALISQIVARLVPFPPEPGEPVPFTPEQWARWS